ncbi:glycine zipper domain-containing protein [Mailhella massiliensis]|uniref:glycine zipper domain-containing protein n=1 Tax=Mailhella massiliensis TaxID=1903261 RepID=UPI002353686B|nr:glycine zipper domain-containing protein [Mailhella massiliensis]
MKKIPVIVLIGALAFGFTGCTNMTRTQQGALSGAAGGALIGGGISALTGGSGTTGALIGGGLGALAGGIYGNQQERNHYDRHW